MKTNSLPPTDGSFCWPEINRIVGSYIRPGGAGLTEKALEICALPIGSRIADIGCGAAGTLEYLERSGPFRLVGLDSSRILLEEAAGRLVSARLVQGLAEKLPFKNNSFDALFCECVLSVLDDKSAPLKEFARVLKDGGFLVLSDVFIQDIPRHTGLRTDVPLARNGLLNFLTELGFSLILWQEHKQLLKEFAARLILAGERLPECWGGRQKLKGNKADHAGISYFLLVARKMGSSEIMGAVNHG